jgi:membrane protease YdiL (CAAX protease family)
MGGMLGREPYGPEPHGAGTEVVASAAVLAYGVIIHRVVPAGAYVPTNLAVAALSVAAARAYGVPFAEMGLRRDRAGRGARIGLIAAAAVAAVIALAVALPATRRYFLDQRAIGGGTGHLLYEVLVRIPFGTALAEEVVFRGSLLGLFLQRHSRTTATAMTSVLFGFWHVVPTLDTLPMNPAGSLTEGDVFRTGVALLLAVLATAAAGWGFAWLRFRSETVVAPAIAHGSINSFALLAGRLVARVLA